MSGINLKAKRYDMVANNKTREIKINSSVPSQGHTVDIKIQSKLNALKNNPTFFILTIAVITIYPYNHCHHCFNHHYYLFNCHNHLHVEYHLQHLDSFNRHHHLYKITLISPQKNNNNNAIW